MLRWIFAALLAASFAAFLLFSFAQSITGRIDRLEATASRVREPLSTAMQYVDSRGNRWIAAPLPGENPLRTAGRLRGMVEGRIEAPCKYASWEDSNGATISVSACQDNTETYEEFCERFDALVEAAQREFPCD